MTTATDKLIADNLCQEYTPHQRLKLSEEVTRYFAGYSFSKHELSQCSGLIDVLISKNLIAKPDDRCANALKIAVEALRDIDGMMFVEEHPVRIRVQEALAEIKREAKKGE